MSFNINEPLKSPELSKEIIDELLKEVGKKYRKAVGKNMPAELIIVGGASVMINYGFRQMTNDVDAIIFAASAMDDAIREVGDENNLPAGWLNTDFKKLNHILISYHNILNIIELSLTFLKLELFHQNILLQ